MIDFFLKFPVAFLIRNFRRHAFLLLYLFGAFLLFTGIRMAMQREHGTHAPEAASRVLTTVDSVLDTLINRTGIG